MKSKYLLSLFFIAPFSVNSALADIDKNIQRAFTVDDGGTLELDTDSGSVEIRSHASNEVLIDVTVRANTDSESKAEDWFEAFEISFEQSGDNVIIDGDLDREGGFFRRNNHLRIKYEITIPKTYNINLDTSGGSFDIGDINGNVRLDTSGGNIKLGKIIGNVRAHTSGGSITTDGVEGDLDISTSGGSLRLSNINGNVVGKTSGGSIRAEVLSQTSDPIELKTSGGSITLSIPADFKANLDASTSGGSVSTELPVLVSGKVRRTSIKGEMNGGGVEILLHTSGGSINVVEL